MRRRYSWYRAPLVSWDGGLFEEAEQPVGGPAELRAAERGTGAPADLELGAPPEAEEDAAEEAWAGLRDADPRLSALFDEEAAHPQQVGGAATGGGGAKGGAPGAAAGRPQLR